MEKNKAIPQLFHKKDFIILCLLVVGVIVMSLFFFLKDKGEFATVRINGKITEQVPLSIDQTYHYENNGHTLTLQVKDHAVSVVSSTCPDKDCVHADPIQYTGTFIACLPANLTVTIDGAFSTDGVTY